MAKNRNLIVLVLAFVVLGGLYLLSNRSRSELDTTGGFVDLVEGQLSTAEVFGVRIWQGSDEGFELVKRGDDWVMSSHDDAPANENKLRTLLGNLETAQAEVRSESSDVLADYSLDDSTAVHLVIKDESGAETLHLLVGERSGSGGFVRRAGSDQALRCGHNFLSDFGVWGEDMSPPQRSQWIDLVAFQVERDEVRSIQLSWADGSLNMAKEFELMEAPADSAAAPAPADYEWRVSDPGDFLAKKTAADGILGSLTNMRARDVVGTATEADAAGRGLAEGGERATLTLADGSTHTLLFGSTLPDADDQIYFQVEGEQLVWSLPNYLRNNVFKDPGELRPE